jgi:DNA-binding NarL/FixJ family response regulator
MPPDATAPREVAPIRVVIADDHAIVLDGLAALLSDEPDIEVVGTATDGRQALALVREHEPDLALLDITMPEMTGLEVARAVSDTLPAVRVLVLTMHEEEAFFFEALRSGAAGYLLKGAQADDLVAAIRAVSAGGIVLPPALAPAIVQDFLDRQPDREALSGLTPREREVVTLIARGLTGSEIAERLTVSLNTIKTHRSHIYAKLNVEDRSQLIDYAIRHGLLHD